MKIEVLGNIWLCFDEFNLIDKCRFRKKWNARTHSASTVASKFARFKSVKADTLVNWI